VAAEKLRAEDFYHEPNRLVWTAMKLLWEARKPIDAITLTDALAAHMNEVGTSHIADLAGRYRQRRLDCASRIYRAETGRPAPIGRLRD
jgi:replicative DNA helicase